MHIRFHNSSRCPKRAIPKCSIFVCKRQEKELGISPFITLRPALCALESLSCISRVALCVCLPLCCKICEGRSFASRGGQCGLDRLRLLEHRQLALGHWVRRSYRRMPVEDSLQLPPWNKYAAESKLPKTKKTKEGRECHDKKNGRKRRYVKLKIRTHQSSREFFYSL